MIRLVKRILLSLFFFAAPMTLYYLLWSAISRDVHNRFGYILWLWASNESALNRPRIFFFELFCMGLLPVLLGVLGVRWGWRLYREYF